jgi:hypothetical protein
VFNPFVHKNFDTLESSIKHPAFSPTKICSFILQLRFVAECEPEYVANECHVVGKTP